jgi:hypothetical protein
MAFESPKSVKVVKLILARQQHFFNVFIPFALLEHFFPDNHRFIIHFIPLAAKCCGKMHETISKDSFPSDVDGKRSSHRWHFTVLDITVGSS